jgi:hypothetical protein
LSRAHQRGHRLSLQPRVLLSGAATGRRNAAPSGRNPDLPQQPERRIYGQSSPSPNR